MLQFYKSTDITEKLVELDFSFQQMAPMGYTKRLLFENHWGDEPILIKHKNEWTSETQRYTAETVNCYRLSTPCSEVPKQGRIHGYPSRVWVGRSSAGAGH